MPVYVYRNLVTNETFEHTQGITEEPLTADPRTGQPVKRIIQPVGIAFKGSGFYVTDSRKPSPTGGAAQKSTGAETGSATKESTPASSSTAPASAND